VESFLYDSESVKVMTVTVKARRFVEPWDVYVSVGVWWLIALLLRVVVHRLLPLANRVRKPENAVISGHTESQLLR